MGAQDGWKRQVLEDLVEECLDRWSLEGNQALEALCLEHPKYAKKLRQLLRRLGRTGLISSSSTDRTEPPAKASQHQTIGDFIVKRRLGAGAMGEVFLVQQAQPRRLVALKVLRHEHRLFTKSRERFRRETDAIASLDHPGICPLYEAGELEGVPYFVMRFVEGETLEERIKKGPPRTPAQVTKIVEIGEKLARALHHAHERGVIHRDVKPANVIIGHDEEPVLLDFGLARATDDESASLTTPGDMIGTPAYMSPEQADGHRLQPSSDVYSLGATLYEALCGKRPHEAPSLSLLRQEILTAAPLPIRRRNRVVPRNTEVVIETALDKQSSRRYSSALELAEDLARIRTHLPILARPAGPCVRLHSWARRRPAIAVALGSTLLLLVSGLFAALASLNAVRTERVATAIALERARINGLVQSSGAVRARSPILSLLLAREAFGAAPGETTRTALMTALAGMQQRASLTAHSDDVLGLVALPDGKSFVSYSEDATARHWGADGSLLATYDHPGPVVDAAISSKDPRWLATASVAGRVSILRLVETGRLDANSSGLSQPPPLELTVAPKSIALDPTDAERAAVGMVDGTLEVWLWRTGRWKLERSLVGHTGCVRCLQFTSDGARLLSCSEDGTARIWSLTSGEEVVLNGHAGPVVSGSITNDGERIATASSSGRVGLWDSTGTLVHWIAGPGYDALHVEFDREGRLLSTSRNGSVVVSRASDGQLLDRLGGHGGGIPSARTAKEEGFVLTSCGDGIVRVFGADGRLRWQLAGHDGYVWDAVFLSGARRIATASRDKSIGLFELGGGAIPALVHATGRVEGVKTCGATETIFTGGDDGVIRCWSSRGEMVSSVSVSGPAGAIQVLDVVAQRGESRDRSRPEAHLVLVRQGGSVALVTTEAEQAIWRTPSAQGAVLIGNRPLVAVAPLAGELRILELESASLVRTLAPRPALDPLGVDGLQDVSKVPPPPSSAEGPGKQAFGALMGLDVSPEGTHVAASFRDGDCVIWDVAGRYEPVALRHRGLCNATFINETLIATACADGVARIWDWKMRSIVHQYECGEDALAVAVSSDGRRLGIGLRSGDALVWEPGQGALVRVKGHHGPVWFLDFVTPDQLVTGGTDGKARVWPLDDRTLIRRSSEWSYRGMTQGERDGVDAPVRVDRRNSSDPP